MNNITYKFDISNENKEFIDRSLELYNFSKNEWLNPIIYKREQKSFGFYAHDGNDVVGGAYGFIDDGYWAYLDLLFVNEKNIETLMLLPI